MIIKNDESLLRIKCADVLSDEIGTLIDTLENELSNANRFGISGIGLAAIQIGIPKNIAIIRINNNIKFDLVNCHIANAYDPKIFRQEGCLSFPG